MDQSSSKRSVSESDLVSRNGNGMRRQTAQIGDRPWFCFWNQTVVEFFIYLTQNTTEFQNGWDSSSSSAVVYTQSTGSAASMSQAMASSTRGAVPAITSPSIQGNNYKRGYGQSDGLPDYPRFIKLEEKRVLMNSPQPYCQQMQILADGNIVPAGTANIVIEENDNAPAAATSSPAPQRRGWSGPSEYRWLGRRQSVNTNTCTCEWLST